MREDQLRAGVVVDELLQPRGDRRQAAAGVDEDRDAALGREREHRDEALVVREELLRARMELDPAGAEVEAAPRLLERALVEVEPDERDEPPFGPRGERERPVVPGAEARPALGLVEAEHVRARHAVAVHPADELVVDADHPVDVVAEMRVRVEDVELRRQAGAHALVPARDDLPCPFERIHPSESTRRLQAWTAAADASLPWTSV